jgi:hypothetical protein
MAPFEVTTRRKPQAGDAKEDDSMRHGNGIEQPRKFAQM